MHSKLEDILNKTKEDLKIRKKQKSLANLKESTRPIKTKSFFDAIINPKLNSVAVIAEIKFASPSIGQLGTPEGLLSKVKQYEKAGATAISIVTEIHFFHGDPKFVMQIKNVTPLPVLQKDFILDKYQIYEASLTGADAILFITKFLSKSELIKFVKLAQKLGLESVVEINDEIDLKKAIETNTKIIAVNARNLTTFDIDVDKACDLMKKIPEQFIKLGFSGISSIIEVEKYKKAGAKAVLIGTSLMKAENIGDFLKELKI